MFLNQLDASNRNGLWKLFSAQSLGASSAPIVIALGGLIGHQLADDPSLATLPVSLYSVGVALSTIPAARLMMGMGRVATYKTGALVCVLASVLATMAIIWQSFELFCVAVALSGFYGACVQNYRFAASDITPAAFKPSAISMIMVGGLVAAVIGPQTVILTTDAIADHKYAGSFVAQGGLALLAVLVLMTLKLPDAKAAHTDAPARPLSQLLAQPRLIVAVIAGAASYALMAFVMTAAPLAMVMHGHDSSDATLGIQWHILAMFGPSFFTGKVIQKTSALTTTAMGLMLLFSASLVALMGMEVGLFWLALILLGLGWNFGFIGATTMLTSCYEPSEKSKVQAVNDFMVFGTAAIASFSAGHQLSVAGWHQLNLATFPFIAAVLVALVLLPWLEKRRG